MCGILGVAGAPDAAAIVLDGLRRLEYRGYDSAGLAIAGNGALAVRRAVGAVDALAALEMPAGSVGIGHTRWATHGPPTEANAHPHRDCAGRIAVVHNGIVENHLELREKLEANGHVFSSQTDTEVIAHLVEMHFAGDLVAAVRGATAQLQGSYALAVVSADAPDRIVAARLKSPLLVGLAEGATVLASDATAIVPHTRRVVFLEDGDVAELTAGGALILDALGQVKTPEVHELAIAANAAEKEGFDHYMLKEIHEIPSALGDLLHGRVGMLGERFDIAGRLTEEELRSAKRLVIVACGTSYYAGVMGKSIIERLAGIPVEVHLASEFRYAPFVQPAESIGIFVSQSGETADTLEALRMAKGEGARSLAFVNVSSSSLAREADGVFELRAGPEIGVASTKAFVNMLGGFYLLGIHLAQVHGRIDAPRAQALAVQLRELPALASRTFALSDEIRAISEEYFLDAADAFFLGRQVTHGLAMEGALKLKEISYVHAEGYAAGELKHGPLALLVGGLPVTALVPPNDATHGVMLSNIVEVQARGAKVLGILCESDEHAAQVVDRALRLPATDPLFYPVPACVALYLLAYHAALARGCPIDKPRNLAKSVTVE